MSEGEEVLPSTLTPKENEVTALCTPSERCKLPWGRLVTCQMFLQNVDLVNTFTFGRLETCTVSLTRKINPNENLLMISKVHFEIKKGNDGLVYLTDFSKNGTFLNKEIVGTGKCVILKSKDEIAIAAPSKTVYIFLNLSQEEDNDFLPRELSDKYVSIQQLGRGACGEVRLVKHRETLNSYAVKKIIMTQTESALNHKINHPLKVKREISILSKLSHPCVISMIDFFQVSREIFIILPYMRGGELTKRILESAMPEDRVKFYFFQILSGIHYLHSEGVIHRDLKPENMLLLDDREETLLKICDFGLSKLTEDSVATTICGTLKYVAPEVMNKNFREGMVYGKRADVWSLGVILYFMVTRELPFKGSDYKTVMNNILQGNCDLTKGVWSNPEKALLKSLLEQMLTVIPERRITVYGIFQHQWLLYDHCVKHRVRQLIREQNSSVSNDSLLDTPTPKKFKFSSSSSDSFESSSTVSGCGNNYCSNSTVCCK